VKRANDDVKCESVGLNAGNPAHRSGRGFPEQNGNAKVSGPIELLEGNAGAGSFELILGLLGRFLGGAFDDGLRSAVNQVLGFLETKGSDCANFLDHCDLLVARVFQDDVECSLLFFFGSSGSGASNGNSSSGNFEGLFEELNELRELDDGQFLESFNELFVGELRHGVASFL
jgi:hypothetical protein